MYKAIIVDDEKMIRNGIKAVLPWQSLDIEEVYTAASGREALELIGEHKPQIMITDISMTEMTGLQLIEKIKEIQPDMRILVLTGYDSFQYAQKCLRLHVDDFFLKPIDEEILAAAVSNQVRKLDQERQMEQEQRLMRRTRGIMEQMILEGIMKGLIHEESTAPDLELLYREYSFKPDQAMQTAILIPTLFEGKKGDDLTLLSIKNICMDIFDSQNRGITFQDEEGRIVIAAFTGETIDEVVNRMDSLINILKDEFASKTKVVLGSVAEGFGRLRISYNDALYLLRSEKSSGENIVQINASEKRYRIFYDTFAELKRTISASVGNSDYIQRIFETFACMVESYNLSDALVDRCCFDIASTLYFAYVVESGESGDNRLNALLMSLLHAKKEEALEYTRSFLQQLFSGEEKSTHELVGKARTFIDENLDKELSVSRLAELLYVTPNYFSRLFKRVTGQGCNEYIVGKRMEKARSLLESTNIKAGKISILVGYQDTNYFSLTFKKHTGMSPTKYRGQFQ